MTTPIRAQILLDGVKATTEARNLAYGEPVVNLSAAGALKQTMRQHLVRKDLPLGTLEALDQVLTKIGRIITGPQVVLDTYVDGATYFAIAGEIDMMAAREKEDQQKVMMQMEDQIVEAQGKTRRPPEPPPDFSGPVRAG